MLRTISPTISIITNFGCDKDCWYCVWKQHSLSRTKQNTDWNKVRCFLKCNKEKGKVSISGGGDPLYNISNNLDWYSKLFEVTKQLNMKVDVHTRAKINNLDFYKNINRCCFSVDSIEDIDYLYKLSTIVKLRLVYVVTSNTTSSNVSQLITMKNKLNCELTLKELYGYDDSDAYKKVKAEFPDLFFLDYGDYNTYFMPDNNIYDKFVF